MPFLPSNQQRQSTEGMSTEVTAGNDNRQRTTQKLNTTRVHHTHKLQLNTMQYNKIIYNVCMVSQRAESEVRNNRIMIIIIKYCRR